MKFIEFVSMIQREKIFLLIVSDHDDIFNITTFYSVIKQTYASFA
jgi:hypothetical protein